MNFALPKHLPRIGAGSKLLHLFCTASLAAPFFAMADTTTQILPFSQDWTSASQITSDDNWSGVPGMVGYLGSGLTGSTGVDPQTILTADTTVDVNANENNPALLSTGGVAEFDGIANRVVALQPTSTANAPSLVVFLDTTGADSVRVQYTLRDIDASIDNAVQPVALQYRVGNSGNFINIPAAFVADASSGPSLATLTTSVDVVLPAAVGNQSHVELRWITANAAGNDEWIGIDDIVVQAVQPPSGIGAASPSIVAAGDPTLLTVTVTPGTAPTSTGLGVTADLTGIGGSATQTFFDDGTAGDQTPGDNVFSYTAIVDLYTADGIKSLPFRITDAQSRTNYGTIALTTTGGVVPEISLSITCNSSNDTVTLQWPQQPGGFNLEYRTNVGMGTWFSFSGIVNSNGGGYSTVATNDVSAKFFRLRKP